MTTNRLFAFISICFGLLMIVGLMLTVTSVPASALAQTSHNLIPISTPQAPVTRVTDMRVIDYRPVMTVAKVYLSSPVSPPSQSDHRLTWYQSNTLSLDGYGFFHDPRVQVVDLPFTLK
jgi:hypothetical protein